MTEVFIVLIVSTIGVLVSVALVIDGILDYRLARRASQPVLAGVAVQHIISESIRLVVLLIFLALAATVTATGGLPDNVLIWSLIAVVVLATSSSIYAWVWRRVQFHDLKEEDTEPVPLT